MNHTDACIRAEWQTGESRCTCSPQPRTIPATSSDPIPYVSPQDPQRDSLVVKLDQLTLNLEMARLKTPPANHDVVSHLRDAATLLELVRAQVLK